MFLGYLHYTLPLNIAYVFIRSFWPRISGMFHLHPKRTKKVKAAEKFRYILRLATGRKETRAYALKQPFCISFTRLDVVRNFSEADECASGHKKIPLL